MVTLPNTFVTVIENMEGSGGTLMIHGYGSIAYRVQTDDGSKFTIKVNNQPFVPNSKFRLLAPQQIATDKKNNGLPEHEQTQMIINASSPVLLLKKRTKTKTITHKQEMSIPVMECNIDFSFSKKFDKAVNKFDKRSTHFSTPGTCMISQPFVIKSRSKMTTMIFLLEIISQIF